MHFQLHYGVSFSSKLLSSFNIFFIYFDEIIIISFSLFHKIHYFRYFDIDWFSFSILFHYYWLLFFDFVIFIFTPADIFSHFLFVLLSPFFFSFDFRLLLSRDYVIIIYFSSFHFHWCSLQPLFPSFSSLIAFDWLFFFITFIITFHYYYFHFRWIIIILLFIRLIMIFFFASTFISFSI